ncbi:MAG: helix-turn-helix transcriptional regulator [Treponema sp.]|jgi:transcriptional regulator with XRE-family HTH domain|nr:helix-turn-helix transcriptional regulator [Treponema sp.]
MKKGSEKLGNMSINQRIVVLRHSLKLTQKGFAQKICISTSFQASIEIEQKKVLDRHVKLIVSAFGVNEAWLRTGEGEMFEKDSTPDYKIAETVDIFKQLNPFFQDFILEQLHKLLEYEKTAKNEVKKRRPAASGSQKAD